MQKVSLALLEAFINFAKNCKDVQLIISSMQKVPVTTSFHLKTKQLDLSFSSKVAMPMIESTTL